QVPTPAVADAAAQLDAVVEHLDGRFFDFQVQPELLRHRLADVDLAEPLQVGQAFEVEQALDEAVGMLHLVDRFGAKLLPQTLVAPVLAHPRVDEVLVDRRELVRENLIEELEDPILTLHAPPPASAAEYTEAGACGQSSQLAFACCASSSIS